jgi:hapalindole-type alkaloid chlorinase
MNDIYQRKIDGFLIKNVLSPQEADTIVSNLCNENKDYRLENPVGYSIPLPFAIAKDEQTVSKYLKGAEYFIKESKNVFKVDIIDKIENIFRQMSGGRKIQIPEGKYSGTHLAPSNIRVLYPYFGGIHLHCGNYFQNEFPSFFDFLSYKVHLINQLSYFIMLNPPENGGELTIYDMEWKDVQTKASLQENDVVTKLIDGSPLMMDQVKRMYIKPSKGDMIMFAGGEIWHRVEDIEGKESRVTVGGFMGFSKDDKAIYYWA